jgi:hypothetical protein
LHLAHVAKKNPKHNTRLGLLWTRSPRNRAVI